MLPNRQVSDLQVNREEGGIFRSNLRAWKAQNQVQCSHHYPECHPRAANMASLLISKKIRSTVPSMCDGDGKGILHRNLCVILFNVPVLYCFYCSVANGMTSIHCGYYLNRRTVQCSICLYINRTCSTITVY